MNTNKPLDVTKPVQFRNARAVVRFLGWVDGSTRCAWAYKSDFKDAEHEHITITQADGKQHPQQENMWDVINTPPPVHYIYINIYSSGPNCYGGFHKSRAEADHRAIGNRLACVKVTYREGQFDE